MCKWAECLVIYAELLGDALYAEIHGDILHVY